MLIEQAGGFTELGPCRGAWFDGQRVVEEPNVAYFVVGPASLKPKLEALLRRRFRQREPFVVAW